MSMNKKMNVQHFLICNFKLARGRVGDKVHKAVDKAPCLQPSRLETLMYSHISLILLFIYFYITLFTPY